MTIALAGEAMVYDVVIVGGGIAGMATAIGLLQRGITNILVLEKALELYPVGASIAIFSNGLKALEYLSSAVANKVKQSCIPIDTMVLQDLQGNVIRETKPPSNTNVNYLVWYLLQQYLAEELPDGILRLGTAVESFRVNNEDHGNDNIVTIETCNRRKTTTETVTTMIQARVLVSADGIHSSIRERLFGSDVTQKHNHEKIMFRAVLPASSVENLAPVGTNLSFQGDEPGKIFHYRETARGILTVTAMARVADVQEPLNDTPNEKKKQLLQVFEGYPPQVQNLLQNISPEAIHVNSIQDIDVLERWSKGPIILIGDAAHAMSPSMGQGANQGLEDACAVVHGLVKQFSSRPLNDEKKSSSSISIDCIWKSRIDRVKMIHAASRVRSKNNNNSSKSEPTDMNSMELKRLLQEIDAWEAPVDDF
jgi:salicylate hydroxylase